MSKQQWKAIALSLVTILLSLVILISITPVSEKLLAQLTSVDQCGINPGLGEYESLRSLVERYGITGANACQKGDWQGNHVEVRADMADWLVAAFDQFDAKLFNSSVNNLPKKDDLAVLNQLYEQVLTQVEALENHQKSR